MATQAHCAYCFESLAASFDRRQPLSLAQVEDLWTQYQNEKHGAGGKGGDDKDETKTQTNEVGTPTASPTSALATSSARPAAISRLLSGEESSAASSSTSLHSSDSASSSSKEPSSTSSRAQSPPASSDTSGSSLIRSRLSSNKKRKTPSDAEQRHPLFVTWNTVSRSSVDANGVPHKTLRGCIGTFEAQELERGLRSYALTSAFEDVRFNPIPASQLPRLSAHVTLLTDFSSPNRDPLAWEIGRHGLRIAFTHRGRRLGSTYLPDVAKEQGWTQDETLNSLMRKAGWSGSDWRRAWREGNGELVTYEGKVVGLGFGEWRAWRDWVEELGVGDEPLN